MFAASPNTPPTTCPISSGSGEPSPTRFAQGHFERHLIVQLTSLLKDDHILRRLSGIEDAEQLRTMFAAARLLVGQLAYNHEREQILQGLIGSVHIHVGHIYVMLKADALKIPTSDNLAWSIPLPERKPFREAKLSMDGDDLGNTIDNELIALLAEAYTAQEMVSPNPEMSLNQLGKRENRCRTHLAKLLRIAWLSPRIVEAIADGTQPAGLTRQKMLAATIPVDWTEQERMLAKSA